jgi:hypothetical protein
VSIPAGGRSAFPGDAADRFAPDSPRCERNQRLRPLFVPSSGSARGAIRELTMNGLIYLIGLIVVIMIILSFLGLR